jgi:hypothetical protein
MSSHSITARVEPGPVGEIGGRSVVLSYAGVATEYEALHRHAVVFDRSHRGRLRVSGSKAGETLTGLVTNDVASLTAGQGQYAARSSRTFASFARKALFSSTSRRAQMRAGSPRCGSM